ncbi:MAG: hypothetical protein R6V53_02175 [Candidatus Woesearchaeota archaeon]
MSLDQDINNAQKDPKLLRWLRIKAGTKKAKNILMTGLMGTLLYTCFNTIDPNQIFEYEHKHTAYGAAPVYYTKAPLEIEELDIRNGQVKELISSIKNKQSNLRNGYSLEREITYDETTIQESPDNEHILFSANHNKVRELCERIGIETPENDNKGKRGIYQVSKSGELELILDQHINIGRMFFYSKDGDYVVFSDNAKRMRKIDLETREKSSATSHDYSTSLYFLLGLAAYSLYRRSKKENPFSWAKENPEPFFYSMLATNGINYTLNTINNFNMGFPLQTISAEYSVPFLVSFLLIDFFYRQKNLNLDYKPFGGLSYQLKSSPQSRIEQLDQMSNTRPVYFIEYAEQHIKNGDMNLALDWLDKGLAWKMNDESSIIRGGVINHLFLPLYKLVNETCSHIAEDGDQWTIQKAYFDLDKRKYTAALSNMQTYTKTALKDSLASKCLHALFLESFRKSLDDSADLYEASKLKDWLTKEVGEGSLESLLEKKSQDIWLDFLNNLDTVNMKSLNATSNTVQTIADNAFLSSRLILKSNPDKSLIKRAYEHTRYVAEKFRDDPEIKIEEPLAFFENEGTLIVNVAKGETLYEQVLAGKESRNLAMTLRGLARYHALIQPTESLRDYVKGISSCQDQLPETLFQELTEAYERLLFLYDAVPTGCSKDCHPKNVIVSDHNVTFIDFERPYEVTVARDLTKLLELYPYSIFSKEEKNDFLKGYIMEYNLHSPQIDPEAMQDAYNLCTADLFLSISGYLSAGSNKNITLTLGKNADHALESLAHSLPEHKPEIELLSKSVRYISKI